MARQRSCLLSLEDADGATVDGPRVIRLDILNALEQAGISRDILDGIESSSKNKWFIVFKTTYERYISIGKTITIGEKDHILRHPIPTRPKEQKYTKVRIFGFPLDSDTELLEKVLAFYGKIKSITDIYDHTCDLKTGVKYALIELKHEIPSFVFVGKHQVRTDYPGQKKTCRKCKKEGHIARECTAGIVCKECGSPDHVKAHCPQQRCYNCQETGHVFASCPKYMSDFPRLDDNEMNTEDNNNKSNTDETPFIVDENVEGENRDELVWSDDRPEHQHTRPMSGLPKDGKSVETTEEQNKGNENNGKIDPKDPKETTTTVTTLIVLENEEINKTKDPTDGKNAKVNTATGVSHKNPTSVILTAHAEKQNLEIDMEEETTIQKRGREQPVSPNRNEKRKKKHPVVVSSAKVRNPFMPT